MRISLIFSLFFLSNFISIVPKLYIYALVYSLYFFTNALVIRISIYTCTHISISIISTYIRICTQNCTSMHSCTHVLAVPFFTNALVNRISIYTCTHKQGTHRWTLVLCSFTHCACIAVRITRVQLYKFTHKKCPEVLMYARYSLSYTHKCTNVLTL